MTFNICLEDVKTFELLELKNIYHGNGDKLATSLQS